MSPIAIALSVGATVRCGGYYSPEEVAIHDPDESLEFYVWGDREVQFKRCSSCGCVTHYVTTELYPDSIVAVNFRMYTNSVIEFIPVRKLHNADS
jgi:hypothetical protein